MSKQLLFLEFNEISLESVKHYCAKGRLPNFRELIERNGYSLTTSESSYEHLEPWIQWVTAHTGLRFSEHGVFRLGDIVNRDFPQIWEQLEEQGLRVGAVCPMNAKHRLKDPAFFIPDPWTRTAMSGPKLLKRVAEAISQTVNDNAQNRLTWRSAAALIAGLIRYARPSNYPRYLKLARGSIGHPWRKALLLDLLLADIYVQQTKKTQPHFATLFLNAGAHIQHHYMFSAASYEGTHRNPPWYVPPGIDPVYEAYELYDHLLGDVRRAFPNARLMLATGLHQVPHAQVTYYWRLKNHESFLRSIDIPFSNVEPRMSRDFLIRCANATQASEAAQRLRQATVSDGSELFEVDNRGSDIFAMLVYAKEITRETRFRIGDREYTNLFPNVVFVALKNGEHDGIGYFIDTAAKKSDRPEEFSLSEIPQRIAAAFGLGALHSAGR
jgi:hypothetical protein